MKEPYIIMARKYNYIYSLLVEGRADIIGHIAYALYKEDKISFIEKFKEEHEDMEPTEADLEQFNNFSSTQSQLDKYKLVSTAILQTFLDNSLDETKKDLEETICRNHISLVEKAIEPIKPSSLWKSYVHGVLQSILGAFVFMMILCGIIFILNFSDNQYSFTFGGKGNAKIEKIDAGTDTTIIKNTHQTP